MSNFMSLIHKKDNNNNNNKNMTPLKLHIDYTRRAE